MIDCAVERALLLLNVARTTRKMAQRAVTTAVAAALLATLASACGRGGAAGHSCATSPPDVVARADVPLGGAEISQAQREAESRYEAMHPDVYAGAISGGGYDWIGFTDDASGHLAELRKQVPNPEAVRAYCATHTNRELVQLQRRIGADTKALVSQGINVTTIGVNTLTERVDIGVIHLNAHIEQTLRDRYGDLVGKVVQTDVVLER